MKQKQSHNKDEWLKEKKKRKTDVDKYLTIIVGKLSYINPKKINK